MDTSINFDNCNTFTTQNNIEIPDKQVLLQFSTNALNKHHKKTIFKINYIKHEINDVVKQQNLEESFNPNPVTGTKTESLL